jgi:5'-methylthioadenosine nucleosidase
MILDASVKDMEAAAVAWVSDLTNTPMFALKVVTDIVDGDRVSQEEFLENLHSAANSLQLTLENVLKFIDGKSLAEL